MAEQGLRRTGGTELNLESMGVNLPYSMQAEQSVLGAALLQADIIPELVETLRPEMFYARQNGQIFAEMVRLFTAGQTVDFVTLLDAVTSEGVFESADAAKVYLTGLAETVPSISNVQAYAKIVQEKYLVRQLMGAAKDILEQSGEEPDADLLLESAEQKIYEIRSGRDTSALTSISSVIVDTLVNLQKIAGPDRDKYAGIPTGFTYLDTVLTRHGPLGPDHSGGPPRHGQNQFCAEHRHQRGKKAEDPRGHFQPGNDQGSADQPYSLGGGGH